MGSSIRIAMLKIAGLLLAASSIQPAHASHFRHAASPGYRPASDVCPTRCIDAGADSANWPVYPGYNQLSDCPDTILYDFSLLDNVDDPDAPHRMFACTSYGPDWTGLQNSTLNAAQAESIDVEYKVGQLDKTVLAAFESSLSSEMMASSIALQWCSPDKDGTHAFGVMATTNRTFAPVRDAIKTWYNASCLDIPDAEAIPGKAYMVTPLLGEPVRNATSGTSFKRSEPRRLAARAECETIEVDQGNGCPELAPRCGISGDDFTKYNDYDDDLCSTLQRGQHGGTHRSALFLLVPREVAIGRIAAVVDFIVFMTYDLHGNVIEMHDALFIITKAGLPSNKISAGTTSYGRSFNMADGDCYPAECYFTGTRLSLGATLGPFTGKSGILVNAEIKKKAIDKLHRQRDILLRKRISRSTHEFEGQICASSNIC
ncbi:uncharacterized protein J7T54_001507 [Emericellopsis cladophorae]|uniref:Chitinase n=1 Tax=Emericellopsis cladophorae TaxID=2686198 RepID=A0A9P9Y253_9HYPO|nr:uncharacterized protein J7T54_001507 [Emericellopsis cladophorae]KAI6781544.1 hypothetical protein J7T54_001507 [Emericellopsis cladophorae]